MARFAAVRTCAIIALATSPACDDRCEPSLWREVAATREAHEAFGLALLASGEVLVVGGHVVGPTEQYIDTVEFYDPATDHWRQTSAMPEPLEGISQLADLTTGELMIVGETSAYETRAQVDVFDPRTETWRQTGPLTTPRAGSVPVRLLDGRVLATGGIDYYAVGRPIHASAELYDPTTGTWSATGDLMAPRIGHRTVRLDDGSVLVVGGTDIEDSDHHIAALDRYVPATGAFRVAGSLQTPRSQHAVTKLTDGRVLIAGGASGSFGHYTSLASTEVYDPVSDTTTIAGDLLEARASFALVTLSDGRALAAGGVDRQSGTALASAELFDPATGTWSACGCLHVARWATQAIALSDGSVLVIGGFNSSLQLRSVERLDRVP